ncbi:hypothetical protein A2662_01985 [Candidatus Giovannonibacteria bacterium RIFCSPHIGHO2_01_FULL_45_33]|nr:MAG: hypothetical protein A2662_01985 [Candidatus Giovannonibacteria bacterium RIFCSPHIGHO2_01_FULL_45_33]
MQLLGMLVLVLGYFGLEIMLGMPDTASEIWLFSSAYFAVCLVARGVGTILYQESRASAGITLLWGILLFLITVCSPVIGAVFSAVIMGAFTTVLLILFLLDAST